MLRISSFNIQNNYTKYSVEKAEAITNYLKSNNIDILGLQEVFNLCDKDICKKIDCGFSCYGKYRFYLKSLLRLINEKNPIITDTINPPKAHKTINIPILITSLVSPPVVTNLVISDI